VWLKRAKLYSEDPSANYTEDASALQPGLGGDYEHSRDGEQRAAKAG
jgi:hypothetical protein